MGLLSEEQPHGLLLTNKTEAIASTERTLEDRERHVSVHQWPVISPMEVCEHPGVPGVTNNSRVMGEM